MNRKTLVHYVVIIICWRLWKMTFSVIAGQKILLGSPAEFLDMNSNRVRQWSKRPLSWSSLNPEERNILTANQLNVQNQKVRQGLQVIHKGIEDEKRCENATRAREEIMLQNRFVRLSKATERIEKRSRFSLLCLENFYERKPSTLPDEKTYHKSASVPILNNASNATGNPHESTVTSDKATSKSSSNTKSEVEVDGGKKHVRFGSATYESVDSSVHRKSEASKQHTTNTRRGSESVDSPSLFSSEESRERSRESTEHGSIKPPPYNALAYYRNPMLRRQSRGFSVATATLPANFDHLQHKTRTKEAYHSRAVLARLKAVRSYSRRHHSHMTLCEAMDADAKQRKELSSRSEPFGANKAWQLLNCRYLRLTPNNVQTLEGVCQDAGYDTSCHPHTQSVDAREEMKPVYKQLRENQVNIPSLPSALHRLK